MKQIFLASVITALCSVSLFAEKVQIGNFYYYLNSADKTAQLTYTKDFDRIHNPHNYRDLGEANIPSSISYKGINYVVTEICDSSFYMCSTLKKISIPKTVKLIGKDALLICPSLQYIYVDDANNYYCSVNNVLFNKSKTTLITYARAKQEMTYSMPNTVKVIEKAAFRGSTLTSIIISNSVIEIKEMAFENCEKLLSITIPNSAKIIEKMAFHNCRKITKIIVPDNVEQIGDNAFGLCWALKVVEIGSGLKEVGNRLFSHCVNLESVICHATIPPTASCDCITYQLNYDKTILYVPEASLQLYQNAIGWQKFPKILAL